VLAAARRAGVLGEVDFWGNLRTADDLNWFRSVFDGVDTVVMPKTRLNAPDAAAQLELAFALKPVVCEFVYDGLSDIAAVRDRFESAGIAMWVNTLDGVACGGFTDTAALERPDEVWGRLIGAGVSVVQTDLAGRMRGWLRPLEQERSASLESAEAEIGSTRTNF
jgi:glycerophosphoryl diester phosphodiesterase